MLAYLKFLYNCFEKMLFQLTDDEEDYYVSGDEESDVETDEEDITDVGVCDSEETTIVDTDSDSEIKMEISSTETEFESNHEYESKPESEDNYCYVRKLVANDDETIGEVFEKVKKDSIKPANIESVIENLPNIHNRKLVKRKLVFSDDGETMWFEEEEEEEEEESNTKNSPKNSDNTDNTDITDITIDNNSPVSKNVFQSMNVYNDNELRKRNTQIIDSMV